MKGKTFQLFSIALAISVVSFFGFSADANAQFTRYTLTQNSDDGAVGINGAATLADGDTVELAGFTLTLNDNTDAGGVYDSLLVLYSGGGGTLITATGAITLDFLGYTDATTGSLNLGTDLTVTQDIQVGGNTLVFVTGAASLTAGGNLHVGDTGVLDFDAGVTIANDISLDGAYAEIQVADATTVTFTGDLTNTAADSLTLTGVAAGGVETFDHNGTITLGADLTLNPDADIVFDVAGVTSFTATSNATYDAAGAGLTWTALATFGGNTGATLTLLSASTTDAYLLDVAVDIQNLTIDDDETVEVDQPSDGGDATVVDGFVLTIAAGAGADAITMPAFATDLVISGKLVYASTTANGLGVGGGTIVVDVTGTLELGSDVEPTAETITFNSGATISVDGSTGDRAATLAGAGAYTIAGDVDFDFDATGGTASLALRALDFDVNANNATFYVSGTNAASLTVGGAGDALMASTGSIIVNGAAGTSLTIDEVELDGAGAIVPNADVTVTSLTLTGNLAYAFNFGGGIITVGSNVDPGTGSLTLGGVGSGSLRPAATQVLDLDGPATLTANNIGLLIEMDITLGAGTIDVDKDLTLSGDIAALANGATVDILAAATLEYTGAGGVTVPAGVTLDFPGGGTFNHTNAIALNAADAVLDITTVDGTELNTVTSAFDGAKIDVGATATIADLQMIGAGATIDFTAAAVTLTLTDSMTLAGGDLSIVGTAAGTLTGSGIYVTGNDAIAVSGAAIATISNYIILDNATGASITTTGAVHVLAGNIITNKQAAITAGAAIDISGDIVVNDTLTINKADVITYTGADIAVGTGQLLTLQGAGAFDGSEADEPGHDIILDGSAVLDLEGTGAVDTVDILSQDVVIEVDASPVTVAAFRTASNGFHLVFTTTNAQLEVVAPITVDMDNSTFYVEGTTSGILYGAGNISLTGANATLQIDNEATPNINKQITLAGGGVLKINQAATFGQTITLSGEATFDIASGQVFSYNKDPLNIGAATLTIMGGGALNNTGTGIVVLNDAASVLAIAGGATATTVNLVTLGVENRPIILESGDGTITTFNRDPVTLDVTFVINSTGTLTIGNALTFDDNETLTLTGAGAGTLAGGLLVVSGESATLLVTNDGGMTIDNNINIGNTVEHSLLDINNDVTISGDISLLAEADFDVNSTLTYSGADIAVGAGDTLFVTGSGDIDMGSNAVVLSTATSVLRFDGTSTVSSVESSNDAATIAVNAAGGIGKLDYTGANGVTIDFLSTDVFTVTDTTSLGNAAVMLLKGETGTEGTLAGTGPIEVTGEAAAIEIDSTLIISKPILIGNAATNAILNVDIDATISGDIMIAANATFDVLAAMTLDYTGGAVNVGTDTLTLVGTGEFANTSAVVLDDAASVLDFTAAMDVGMVESGANGAKIDVGAAGTIETLSFTGAGGGVTFDFTTASTFTVTDVAVLPGGAVFTIGGAAAGTLAGTDAVVFSDSDTLKYDNAGIGITKILTFGGADVTPSVLDINDRAVLAGVVDFAGYVDFLVADTLTLSGGVTTSDASVLSASAVDSVILTGGIDLYDNLTFVGVGFDITGITELWAMTNSTLTFPDSLLTFTAMTDVGGSDAILTLMSSFDEAYITIPDVDIWGTVSLAGDDTLMFDGLVAMAGNVEMNGTGKLVIVPPVGGLTISAMLYAATGLIEIDSVGTSGQGNITLAADGVYKVDDAAGEIILPRTKETTVTGGIIVLTNGILRGGGPIAEGEEQHTIVNAIAATVAGMTGGIIHNIEFDPPIMAFSTKGTNVTGYSITVYINFLTGDDATGDGSLGAPYKTLEKGYAEAVDMGIVSVAAATYTLTATLTINKEITIEGTKLDGTTESWTGGTAGAADEAPTITYSGGALAGLFVIAADNVTIQGLKIDMVNDVSRGIEFADTTVDNASITYNTFMMDDGDRAVSVDDGGTVTNLGIMWNHFIGNSGDWFVIGEMDSVTVDDVDATNNVIEYAAAQLRLGKGDISDIAFFYNTFMNNNGIKLLEPVEQSDGMFSDISVTDNKFKGDMDYAFLIADDVENADFVNDINDDVTVTNNHFFFGTGGSYEAVSNMVTDASTSINAENNWWGSIEGPNQAGGADVSANVDYTVWKFLPELAGNEVVISAVSGGQRSGIPIYATVYAGFTGAVEFGTINFDATTSGLFAVEANNPNAYAEQTFMITPNNTAEVTDAQITVFQTGAPTVLDVSNVFDITVLSAADINAIGTLNATDFPQDGGGYVVLEFVASPNHPGYTTVPGYVGDTAPIDYYQIYRSTTGSFEQAIHWSVAAATPKAQTQVTDTVRILVSTAGDLSGNATYYVTAVKGDLPPPLTTETPGAAAKAGVLVAYKPALAKTAGDDASFTSEVSNGDRAIGAANYADLTADFTSDKVVDLADLNLFVWAFGNDDEYDPLFEIGDDNNTVDLADLNEFVSQFGNTIASKAPGYSDGLNANSAFELSGDFDYATEMITLEITGIDFESLTGYSFDLTFDPEEFELIETSDAGLLGTSIMFIYNDHNDGRVSIASIIVGYTEESAAEGEGTVAYVNLHRIGRNTGSISLMNVQVLDHLGKLNTLDESTLDTPVLPLRFELRNNYPNPFNPATTIEYTLPTSENVSLVIYNSVGQVVRTLVSSQQNAGEKKVVWDGTNDRGIRVSSGMYIYRITAGSHTSQKMMMFIK